MDASDAACDNLPRNGVCLGIVGLLVGLAIAGMALGRTIGFGAAPALGLEAIDIQARVQLFAGCLPIMVALVWALAVPHDEVVSRLRPLVTTLILVSFLSGMSVMVLNWAIVMGHVADHVALVPALADVVVAILYMVLLVAMPVGANIAVASQMIMRSGAMWLLATTIIRLAATAGRVFLDADSFMWFFDTPAVEMVLLGFVIPSAIALIMGSMSSIGDPRAIMRNLPTQLQFWHTLVFLWFALRVWCLRYPGSYQKLVLALVGIALMVVISTMVGDTSILQRIFIPTKWSGGRRDGLNLAGASFGMSLMACLVLVATAMMVAGTNGTPPAELLSALLMATLVGVVLATTGSVIMSICSDYPGDYPVRAKGFFIQTIMAASAGALVAALLWPLTMVVERSLTPALLGAVALVAIGTCLALAWVAFVWRPWHGDYEGDEVYDE